MLLESASYLKLEIILGQACIAGSCIFVWEGNYDQILKVFNAVVADLAQTLPWKLVIHLLQLSQWYYPDLSSKGATASRPTAEWHSADKGYPTLNIQSH